MHLRRCPIRTLLTLLMIVGLAAPAISQAAVAERTVSLEAIAQSTGAAMTRAQELLRVLNDGSAEAIGRLVRETFNEQFRSAVPVEQHMSILSSVHERGAPWEIEEVGSETDTQVELLLHGTRADEWATLRVAVEEAAPHLIASIGLAPATAPPAEAAGDGYTAAEIREQMDSLIDELTQEDRFSGAVRLVRSGEVVYEAVRGEANKDFDVPNRIDTKFNLGSMNKMFTAVAIAQLVERGEISWEDPLSKFLPEFPDAESADRIRIEHLLTHTSGLGSYFNDEFMSASRARFRTVSDLMELADEETLQFEPGTQWSYSNTGFLVLGRVIEVVTGQDYHDYIRANVTGPAGMHSTDCYQLDHVNPNLAVGYDLQDGVWRNNLFMHVIRGGPAGGGYSTVGDLVRFANALRDGTLVSAETLELLTTPKPDLNSPRYGFGFGINPDGSVGHSGGFLGINSYLAFWPDGDWTIAAMSNYSGGAQPVVQRASRLIGEAAR